MRRERVRERRNIGNEVRREGDTDNRGRKSLIIHFFYSFIYFLFLFLLGGGGGGMMGLWLKRGVKGVAKEEEGKGMILKSKKGVERERGGGGEFFKK